MSHITLRYPSTDLPTDEKHEPLLDDQPTDQPTLKGSRSFESSSYIVHPSEDDFPISASSLNRSMHPSNRLTSQSNGRLASQSTNHVDDGKMTFTTATKVLAFIVVLLIAAIIALLYEKLESPQVKPLFPPNEPGIPTEPELGWEATYQSLFKDTSYNARMSSHLQYLSNNTHLAGSSYDYQTALYVQQAMMTAGIPIVTIEQHAVLLSTPISRSLQMTAPVKYVANLTEAVYDVDPTSSRSDVPTFHSYSANGTLIGYDVVFAHYCKREHFDLVHSHNVTTQGKICLCRYGDGWRGDKVSQATDAGCAGVLIYSDPASDGYVNGTVYPDGPWKPETGVQRGSIMNGNGDPLTPDWPSAADPTQGYRLGVSDARGPAGRLNNDTPLPTIPSLPISWHDALPILSAMKGPAIDQWKGGLNITYRLGGDGSLKVDFIISLREATSPIWNVIGTIPGDTFPEQQVLMGAHRDSWTFGAIDPLSGTIALLGTAEGLGAMLKQGWTPSRTITICSWDGEEQGLIGSVEFVDDHETSLLMNAIAYINMDEAVTGFDELDIDGHPVLSVMLSDIAKSIPAPHPNESLSLYDYFMISEPQMLPGFDVPILNDIGGTGSDFGGFVQRVGVLSLDLGFTSSEGYYSGVYHTSYDSFTWMNRFGDGRNHYDYHSCMSQLIGSLAMRLADSQILPITMAPYSALLKSKFASLQANGVKTFPALTAAFNQFSNAIDAFDQACIAFDVSVAQLALQISSDTPPPSWKLQSINNLLATVDRYFLYLPGIPGRSWYRHLVFATSLSDGYSGDGLAILSDAIDDQDQNACARSLWFLQHSVLSLVRQMSILA